MKLNDLTNWSLISAPHWHWLRDGAEFPNGNGFQTLCSHVRPEALYEQSHTQTNTKYTLYFPNQYQLKPFALLWESQKNTDFQMNFSHIIVDVYFNDH